MRDRGEGQVGNNQNTFDQYLSANIYLVDCDLYVDMNWRQLCACVPL